ncbi:type IV pilus modification protein PilV [Dokdonella sp. MW10]|uniref:type IV pilus modification protein PilV n=1 Tax=Dokdonella sp. MW10 TaxID=2992926 RepID=UPI003F7D858E
MTTSRCLRGIARGFTLLEVLIALLIMSFGLLGLAALQVYSVKTNQSAHLRSQATALANMIMDSMRANRGALLNYYSDSYPAATCTPGVATASDAAGRDLAFWRQQIACLLPEGRGAVAPISATEVAICIRWSDARWESAAGSAAGRCTADAATFGAGLTAGGPGAGTDGQFSVFVVSSRM